MNNKELAAAIKAEVVKQAPEMEGMFAKSTTGTQIDAFNADMDAAPGQIPERVIEELRAACHQAVDFAGAFSDACKAQAEKYKIKPGALKRYIKALEGDKLEDVEAETDDLQNLIAHRAAP